MTTENRREKSILTRPMTRRRLLTLGGATALGIGALGFEGCVRQVIAVEVVRVPIRLSKLEAPFRLAQISDLHYGDGLTPCESLAQKVGSLKPDLVALTGDALSDLKSIERLETLMGALDCPVYVAPGNWEHWIKWSLSDQAKFYDKFGAAFLLNRNTSTMGVNLVGIDDPYVGDADLEKAMKGIDPNRPTVLIAHAPIIASKAERAGVDLTICGHTHGGQIRLPLYGPLWLPLGTGDYPIGRYEIGAMTLYVNRGIGTSLLPIRLFCPPEITLFEFEPV